MKKRQEVLYPLGREKVPLTWRYDAAITDQLNIHLGFFADMGVQFLIGIEQEFVFKAAAAAHAEPCVRALLGECAFLRPDSSVENQDLYDDNGVFEVRFHCPVAPHLAIKQYHQLLFHLNRLSKQFGLSLQLKGKHVNISAWKGDVNIMDSSNASSFYAPFCDGILKCVYDGALGLFSMQQLDELTFMPFMCDAGPGRSPLLSIRRDRFELRDRVCDVLPRPHLSYALLVMLSGMRLGYDLQQSRVHKPVLFLSSASKKRCHFTGPKEFKILLVVLNACFLSSDNSLLPPKNYLERTQMRLVRELGVPPVLFKHSRHLLCEFFKGIKINDDNSIVWPEEEMRALCVTSKVMLNAIQCVSKDVGTLQNDGYNLKYPDDRVLLGLSYSAKATPMQLRLLERFQESPVVSRYFSSQLQHALTTTFNEACKQYRKPDKDPPSPGCSASFLAGFFVDIVSVVRGIS